MKKLSKKSKVVEPIDGDQEETADTEELDELGFHEETEEGIETADEIDEDDLDEEEIDIDAEFSEFTGANKDVLADDDEIIDEDDEEEEDLFADEDEDGDDF